MQKVLISTGIKNIVLSDAGIDFLVEHEGFNRDDVNPYILTARGTNEVYSLRTIHPVIRMVKALGDKAFHPRTVYKIVSIPNDVAWQITEHYGVEIVEELHRVWY